jgi:hypothetical protein
MHVLLWKPRHYPYPLQPFDIISYHIIPSSCSLHRNPITLPSAVQQNYRTHSLVLPCFPLYHSHLVLSSVPQLMANSRNNIGHVVIYMIVGLFCLLNVYLRILTRAFFVNKIPQHSLVRSIYVPR